MVNQTNYCEYRDALEVGTSHRPDTGPRTALKVSKFPCFPGGVQLVSTGFDSWENGRSLSQMLHVFKVYLHIISIKQFLSSFLKQMCDAFQGYVFGYVRICPDCWGRWGPWGFVGPLFPGGIVCRTTGSTSTCS
jgi:hypothetical protein